jgi:hypothetical protein
MDRLSSSRADGNPHNPSQAEDPLLAMPHADRIRAQSGDCTSSTSSRNI